MSNDSMASFFGRGSSRPATEEAERAHSLSEDERRIVYVGATALLLTMALLVLAFGGRTTGISACKGILLQSQRVSCYQTLAYGQQNATICGYIPAGQQHDGCIATIAEAKQNATLCATLGSASALYSQCILNVSATTGNANYCQLLNGSLQSSCAFNLARAHGFTSLAACAAIADVALKSECTYVNYYNSALVTENTTYCSRVPKGSNSTLLSLMLAENISITSGVQQSGFLNLNATPQGYCYYRLAALTRNKALCSFTTGLLGYVCNTTVSGTTTSSTPNATSLSSACASVPSYLATLCTSALLTSQAINAKNISKCLQIPSVQYQQTCITTYAIKFTNSSYCSYITNATVQQQCSVSVTSGAKKGS